MKKVLVVDNSSYMRLFVKKIIEKGGSYEVSEAEGKYDALERFEIEKPDSVILDLNMSEFTMDGIDVLKEIKRMNPNANVIIMSAVGHQEVKDQCLELGAKAYIKKPINAKELLNALE
jgi:two-component system chemotaxis response regulator CheY